MSNESTWCVHIQGPDDVLPARDRIDAMRQAQEINAASLVMLLDNENNEYYPTMWAVPIRRSDLYTSEAV